MAVEDMMNLRCTVMRRTTAVRDSVGGIVQAPEVVATGLPCCVQQMSASEREAHGRVGVIASHLVWLPAGAKAHIDRTCRLKVRQGLGDRFFEVAHVQDPQERERFIEVAALEYQGESDVSR